MNSAELDKRFSFARLALLIRNRAVDDAAAFANANTLAELQQLQSSAAHKA